MLNNKKFAKLVNCSQLLEEDPHNPNAAALIHRCFAQAALPYRSSKGSSFSVKNGNFTMSIMGNHESGLPYGLMPRLLLQHFCTEAVDRKTSIVSLEKSLSALMKKLGFSPTGGENGNVKAFRSQLERLIECSVTLRYKDNILYRINNIRPIESAYLWSSDKSVDEENIESPLTPHICLSQDFFESLVLTYVPLDKRVVEALRPSPMAVDIYAWLADQCGRLKKEAFVPWQNLMFQFGATWEQNSDTKANFKKKFSANFDKVQIASNLPAYLHTEGVVFPSP